MTHRTANYREIASHQQMPKKATSKKAPPEQAEPRPKPDADLAAALF
jgi:hypothetical protein